jgi:hypothetical protein
MHIRAGREEQTHPLADLGTNHDISMRDGAGSSTLLQHSQRKDLEVEATEQY